MKLAELLDNLGIDRDAMSNPNDLELEVVIDGPVTLTPSAVTFDYPNGQILIDVDTV